MMINAEPERDHVLQYLALGDSYTIGESVLENQRWPNQLSALLQESQNCKVETTIVAKTGWTTGELIDAIEETQLLAKYALVSLLIGVNNQYRGYDIDQYQVEFEQLLLKAIAFAGGNKQAVFVLSIPDYGVTSFAQDKNPDKIAIQIDAFNSKAELICKEQQVAFISITESSRKAIENRDLIANDGLHPSGKMYQEWLDIVFPKVLNLFK